MCAILGALFWNIDSPDKVQLLNNMLGSMMERAHQRGRDGRGYVINTNAQLFPNTYRGVNRVEMGDAEGALFSHEFLDRNGSIEAGSFIANTRAEPTTEYVKKKRIVDQQPYTSAPWSIVHNGTIANDKALRDYDVPTSIDSAAIAETLRRNCGGERFVDCTEVFTRSVRQLVGSYAVAAVHNELPGALFLACNYRPIWYLVTPFGLFFASCESYLPQGMGNPKMMEPYSVSAFEYDPMTGSVRHGQNFLQERKTKRALVVCSGGMDSVVAAVAAQKMMSCDIELIHFMYKSRAEAPEMLAVDRVAKRLGVPLHFIPMDIYDPKSSPLLQADSAVAGGEAGAEFAHEWVPARNLVMLALATAYAESNGFDTIVLGNNLEEAGAYPDNEPEFINRLNAVMPFAVGDGKRVRIEMPVGNLMKHEIVKLGLELDAPLDLTWSCYRAGKLHCGKCGPCYMRRTAFAINEVNEVITYQE